MTWRNKAEKQIQSICRAEYLRVNTTKSGKKRRRHVSYTIPQEALDLLECLNTNDEERAKAIFVWR